MTALPSDAHRRGLHWVLASQFLSAFGDNALLFGAIALLKQQAYPAWSVPVLQEVFVAAYILLAVVAGPLADSHPKGRVMLFTNLMKLLGAAAILAGLNPFVGYALVGVGAALYSPAKYGILRQLVPAEGLVHANGWMESSTIAAILLGAIVGGALSDHSVHLALGAAAAAYLGALLANARIPVLPPANPGTHTGMWTEFLAAVRAIWRIRDARTSLLGTSLFWGAGATLRFAMVAWVPVALGVAGTGMPAYLNAMVAVGVVVGAVIAGKYVTLEQFRRVLPAGLMVGAMATLLSVQTSAPVSFALLALLGGFGGLFVVPLNAVLQEHGHHAAGAGNAIAVQNLFENVVMLVLVAAYIGLTALGIAVVPVVAAFGALLTVLMGALWWSSLYRSASRANTA